MNYFTLGINHRSAPVEVRERFAILPDRQVEFLSAASALPHVEEVLLLSTCNRVEIYGVSRHLPQASQQMLHFLADFQNCEAAVFERHAYFFEGLEAIQHGFRVAASLDSMIIGEPQILGQVKDAYRLANESGTTGSHLNKFFHRAFHVAKKIRTETSIANHPVSVSYAAVVLAKQIFGDLAGKKVLILGAGKMSELAMRYFKNSGIAKIFIANRSPDRAENAAAKVDGEVVPFERFEKWLSDADIVVASTAASDYLITPEMVQEAIRQRQSRPMFFIDIAVPRNVSPSVNHLAGVYLYDIDDLGAVVEANRAQRLKEAERAGVILEKEAGEFLRAVESLQAVPTISSLSRKFDRICQKELQRAFSELPNLDAAGREALERLAHSIINKILHDPMLALKQADPSMRPVDYSSILKKLFRLDEA